MIDCDETKRWIMKIAMVAGELSGDLLGVGLIRELKKYYPQAQFEGIGGPKMLQTGFLSHYPLETLSVMGLIEVLKHYRTIKRCRDNLYDHWLKNPPDVFIGIDAPDFNLRLEYLLKKKGIPTVHYVSPSVWAWRQYRLPKIARSCDLMLTLFPFEAHYYQQHHIPVEFVGHPLADDIALEEADPKIARQQLGLSAEATTRFIALLPGSRYQEVEKLGEIFLQTAKWLQQRNSHLHFVVPLVNNSRIKKLFASQVSAIAPTLPLTVVTEQAQQVMQAADVVLMASGTATLEALLLKRPMVVAYRLAPLTYWLAKWLVHTPYFALPNLLAQRQLIPEFLQQAVNCENLGNHVLFLLENPQFINQLKTEFMKLHYHLRQSANQQAAKAVFSLLKTQCHSNFI